MWGWPLIPVAEVVEEPVVELLQAEEQEILLQSHLHKELMEVLEEVHLLPHL